MILWTVPPVWPQTPKIKIHIDSHAPSEFELLPIVFGLCLWIVPWNYCNRSLQRQNKEARVWWVLICLDKMCRSLLKNAVLYVCMYVWLFFCLKIYKPFYLLTFYGIREEKFLLWPKNLTTWKFFLSQGSNFAFVVTDLWQTKYSLLITLHHRCTVLWIRKKKKQCFPVWGLKFTSGFLRLCSLSCSSFKIMCWWWTY